VVNLTHAHGVDLVKAGDAVLQVQGEPVERDGDAGAGQGIQLRDGLAGGGVAPHSVGLDVRHLAQGQILVLRVGVALAVQVEFTAGDQ